MASEKILVQSPPSSWVHGKDDGGGGGRIVTIERKSVKGFRSKDEYLDAMKEDLSEWFNGLYDLTTTPDDFFENIETGVLLCRHANTAHRFIVEAAAAGSKSGSKKANNLSPAIIDRTKNNVESNGDGAAGPVAFRTGVKAGTFQARDNVSNFIAWCRHALRVPDSLLFETDDLVMRKNERNVVLCLLETARRAVKFGMPAPVLIQMEQEIDAEIAAGDAAVVVVADPSSRPDQNLTSGRRYPPIKVDMMSLDEMVSGPR